MDRLEEVEKRLEEMYAEGIFSEELLDLQEEYTTLLNSQKYNKLDEFLDEYLTDTREDKEFNLDYYIRNLNYTFKLGLLEIEIRDLYRKAKDINIDPIIFIQEFNLYMKESYCCYIKLKYFLDIDQLEQDILIYSLDPIKIKIDDKVKTQKIIKKGQELECRFLIGF